jgi:hypothetical protein
MCCTAHSKQVLLAHKRLLLLQPAIVAVIITITPGLRWIHTQKQHMHAMRWAWHKAGTTKRPKPSI